MADEAEIRPFRVEIPDDAIADLRRRIAAARWPSKELVDDRSQGVQLATIQELARYWTAEYDWRKCEARLNALPQFKTEIDGVDIHFIHVKSQHESALPLIMTHGWPGSIIELLETVGPLIDPTVHGGAASEAFDLVLPSLPGFGLSAEPTEVGWDPGRIAGVAELMRRLGYVAQGGDLGGYVCDEMGRRAPAGAAWHPPQLAQDGAGRPCASGTLRARTFRAGSDRHHADQRLRLFPGAGHAAADDRLRPAGFTPRPGGLDARP
jgi:Epoxide hydrolase N terminus